MPAIQGGEDMTGLLVMVMVRLRYILKNWVLNPTSKANAFVLVDLVQEHLNFWIKVYYLCIAIAFALLISLIDNLQGS